MNKFGLTVGLGNGAAFDLFPVIAPRCGRRSAVRLRLDPLDALRRRAARHDILGMQADPPSVMAALVAAIQRGARRAATGSAPRSQRAAGFTLLEVLVAFTILALMLTVLLRIFSEGFRSMTAAEAHATAALHAQAALASVGAEIPLTVGEREGEHADGFRWRVSIDLYAEPGMVIPLQAFVVYRVVASAEHETGAGAVTLSSLRIGGAEPAEPGEEVGVAGAPR